MSEGCFGGCEPELSRRARGATAIMFCVENEVNNCCAETGKLMQFFKALVPWNLGLMCIHIWIYCGTHRGLPNGDVPLMTVMYVVLSLALVIMLFSDLSHPLDEKHKRVIDVGCAVVMSASMLFLSLPLPLSPTLTTLFGAVLGGAGAGWVYARWVEFYAKLDIHYAAPLVFFTMMCGSFCKAIVDLLPAVPGTIVLMVVPFLAFYTLYKSEETRVESSEPYVFYNSRTIMSLSRLGFGIAIYSFMVGVIQATPLAFAASTGPVAILAKHGGEIFIGLYMFVWVVVVKRGISFGRIWNIVLVLMATSLMFAPYLDDTTGGYLFTFVGVAQTFVIIILFLALADIARHGTYSAITVFSAGWLAYTLPFAVGDIVVQEVDSIAPGSSLVMAAIAWVLVVVSLLFFDESSAGKRLIFTELNDEADGDTSAKRMGDVQEQLDEAQAGTADALALRCKALAEQEKLTPREHEVMELLARGRSKAYIAEAFFISENTVRGHVKRIYSKLGVHNKQELVDRVEQMSL